METQITIATVERSDLTEYGAFDKMNFLFI